MAKIASRGQIRKRIHERVRKKVRGTSSRPRLNVFRSSRHIYAQIIDDDHGQTLAAVSTIDRIIKEKNANGGNMAAAKIVGAEIARRAMTKGIKNVVYDRGGYLFHGRIKVLAEAAREEGLKF